MYLEREWMADDIPQSRCSARCERSGRHVEFKESRERVDSVGNKRKKGKTMRSTIKMFKV